MGKLFIFGIGGTGSRVIRSLTYLLASGVKINASQVIPIIVDPDHGNGDLKRTVEVLKWYSEIRSRLEFKTDYDYFKTELTTLDNLQARKTGSTAKEVYDGFKFKLKGTKGSLFKNYIGFEQLTSEANTDMMSLLFSEDNLNADMDVGFKGNPNIGSVVLNQFDDSPEYRTFASNFAEGDRIFIISSIFGGTGAAGFPLLLKNFRSADKSIPNWERLREAPVGALSMLPYFGVKPDDNSKIDKGTFNSKAKSALSYYERNITGNRSINTMYYLGDDVTKDYENHEGAELQENQAHLLEVLGASAVIDFMEIPEDNLQVVDGKVLREDDTMTREHGMLENDDPVFTTTFGKITRKRLMEPMTRYFLMEEYLRRRMKGAVKSKQAWTQANISLDDSFFGDTFYTTILEKFNTAYLKWLQELSDNKRSFRPFDLNVADKNFFMLLNGSKEVKGWNPLEKNNFVLYDGVLNKASMEVGDFNQVEQLFSLFGLATNTLYNTKFSVK